MEEESPPPFTASRTDMIRKAERGDINALRAVYDEARERMWEGGNTRQWKIGHPPLSVIESDISGGFLYVIVESNEIVGAFSIIGKEPTYDTIYDGSWPEGDYDYVTIHRVAGKRKASHVLRQAVVTASLLSPVIRIDTHVDNRKMQALILKYGFTYCGKITLLDGSMRIAFQKG